MEKIYFFAFFTEDFGTNPHPEPLVRGTDPRIRIRTKMSRIRNTALMVVKYGSLFSSLSSK
jgi:hypothetical protein